jgi:hypothetical protein
MSTGSFGWDELTDGVNRIARIDILISDNSGEIERSGFLAWASLSGETPKLKKEESDSSSV